MSDVFRTFIAENQSLEFSYDEAKIRRKTVSHQQTPSCEIL